MILVFSPTGNTKEMAGYISELTDIEMTEIIPVVPYTEEDRNWRNEESRTFKEFKDNTIRPEIETTVINNLFRNFKFIDIFQDLFLVCQIFLHQ